MNSHCYDDIINIPHHRSITRPHMSNSSRAAQFAPFAALTGYDAAVNETARLTGQRLDLSEDARAYLDLQLKLLMEQLSDRPEISVTYFVPDKRKPGGLYETASGFIRRIDEYEGMLQFTDGRKIPLSEICFIEGEYQLNAPTFSNRKGNLFLFRFLKK